VKKISFLTPINLSSFTLHLQLLASPSSRSQKDSNAISGNVLGNFSVSTLSLPTQKSTPISQLFQYFQFY